MGERKQKRSARARSLAWPLPALAAIALFLLAAPAASADYEQVPEHFGAAQLGESTAMAVNSGGEGLPAAEAGSFYVVGRNRFVLRYAPGVEGEEPSFREAWGWGVANHAKQYQRCGPAYAGSADPATEHTFETCGFSAAGYPGEEKTGYFGELSGVAVDQATGYVYVLNVKNGVREHHLIEVFTATGTPVGEGFGDSGRKTPAPPESIAEGPEKLHLMFATKGAIAVDEAGTVYVGDLDYLGAADPQARVMSFEPESPGDYEHYVYAGQAHDIVSESGQQFLRIALAPGGRLTTANGELIRTYAIGGAGTPLCSRSVEGQLQSMTANPASGEVFYFTFSDRSLHRLGPCDAATGKYAELQEAVKPAPETKALLALAVNAKRSWGPLRPPGVLYGADYEEHGEQKGIGDVFVPAQAFAPLVEAESATTTTTSSTTLGARIDPNGFATSYRFQYLTQAAYEANEPDERQALTVKATGGLFGLGFEGETLGGEATADLTNGSKLAEGLSTAAGTATLHAALGSADLHGAVGKGTAIAGSDKITAASATEGAFATGQTIRGEGIPAGTTISAVSGSQLTLSAAATKSIAGTPLRAGTATLTAASAAEGEFEPGQAISGEGIPANTMIAAVSGAELTLSTGVEGPGSAVEVKAGSTTLSGLSVAEGSFIAGQPISGVGIPAGAKIEAVHLSSLEISSPVTEPGAGVAISSSGPAPLAVGETVEGPGIAAGTKIAAIQAGKLTLSQPAEATEAGAHLRAGLAFDASAAEVRRALEGLAAIGTGNVRVSGGPGDEVGSHPYEVTFTGRLTNTDLPALSADSAGLTGGPATATVATAHEGGGGFDHGALQAPAGSLGSGSAATVSAALSGLAPDTAYRFRAIASSPCEGAGEPDCVTVGGVAAFSTYPDPLAAPPDGRAYELVSPAQKHGGEVFPADPGLSSCTNPDGIPFGGECKPPGSGISVVFPMQSAPGGDAVSYMGFPFSPTEGASVFNSYISRRGESGWQTTVMSPALLATKGGEDLAFGEDLGAGTIFQHNPQLAPGAPAGYANVYLQDTSDPDALTPLLSAPPPNRGEGGLTFKYAGATPDFTRQYFAANDALTGATAYAPAPPDPGGEGRDLYEWRGGALALVNVMPGNAEVATGASFASADPDAHGASEDGRRVFFEAGGTLYVREDGKITREVTRPGSFLAASPDGLRVLLGDGCLYSLASEACADLTQGEGGFLGTLGASEDLSRIYFADTAALPGSGENQRGEEARAGEKNLYLHRAGAGAEFIATLASADGKGGQEFLNDWGADAQRQRTAEASPSGRYLAFASTAGLTGYDNVGPCRADFNVSKGEYEVVFVPCKEAFLYDSATGKLACASCNPSGEAPRGDSTLRRVEAARAWQPQPRYVTDSGRLYFDSQDRLSPRDSNGRVEDVYEYEPSGAGSCARAAGCVALISPGTGTVDSNLLAVDGSGANVFFTTRERLVGKDTDELIDLYDAREGGGFASESETQRAECSGEACQPTPSAPQAQTPASAAYHGAGNVSQAASPFARCNRAGRKARGLSRRAKKLRRGAHRAARRNPRRARALRRKAARYAGAARKQSGQAKRCRARVRKNGRTNR